jgi:hypothetical protein
MGRNLKRGAARRAGIRAAAADGRGRRARPLAARGRVGLSGPDRTDDAAC